MLHPLPYMSGFNALVEKFDTFELLGPLGFILAKQVFQFCVSILRQTVQIDFLRVGKNSIGILLGADVGADLLLVGVYLLQDDLHVTVQICLYDSD